MRHSQSNDPNAYRGQAPDDAEYRQRTTQQGYQQTGSQHPQTGQRGQQPAQNYAPPSQYGQPQQSTYQQQYAQPAAGQPQQGGQTSPTGAVQPAGGMQQQAGRARQQAQAPPRPRLQPFTVDEIVTTDVVTAERSTPIRTIVAQMAERNVGSVIIVEERAPIGILTDREIALALESIPDVAERQAGELLSENLVTGTTEMTVFDVLRRLSEQDIRRLPIVDDDGSLQGIVTLDDILVLLGAELNNATEIIEGQSPSL